MGFGGSSTPVPEPEPIPQVPIQDSPNSLEVARADAVRAKKQDGSRAHNLTSGGTKGDTSIIKQQRKSLIA